MIFMAELSCLLATAISLESFARLTLVRLSDWAMRLKSFTGLMSFHNFVLAKKMTSRNTYDSLLRLHPFL